MADSVREVTVQSHAAEGASVRPDRVAVEEPLEIRVQREGDSARHSVAITMRTPGHDAELAAGFLVSEAVVAAPGMIRNLRHCGAPGSPQENVINVTLAADAAFDPERLSRNVYTSSSCGICGKASIEMIQAVNPPALTGEFRIPFSVLRTLPDRLGQAQPAFAATGGLHAAALFDAAGTLRLAREDVGRHNAVDKLVGSLYLDNRLPARDALLLVSGRASYELVQKALMAGIPMLAAVGAPSSLAIETARAFGATLAGFLRDGRCNVYSGEERVVSGSS